MPLANTLDATHTAEEIHHVNPGYKIPMANVLEDYWKQFLPKDGVSDFAHGGLVKGYAHAAVHS